VLKVFIRTANWLPRGRRLHVALKSTFDPCVLPTTLAPACRIPNLVERRHGSCPVELVGVHDGTGDSRFAHMALQMLSRRDDGIPQGEPCHHVSFV
jgi:hypothetical protein